MLKFITRPLLINIFSLWFCSFLIGSLQFSGGIRSLLLLAVFLTAVHLLVKPLLDLLLGSMNFLTLGLIGLVADSAILFLLTLYYPEVKIIPWSFPGLSIEGFTIPPMTFNVPGGTVLSAFIINFIRQILLVLA